MSFGIVSVGLLKYESHRAKKNCSMFEPRTAGE
jgi:hypothetical protein